MERRVIRRPQSDNTEVEQPKRRQSIMPSGMGKPQMVTATNTEPKISDKSIPSSQPHTQTRRKRPKFEERFNRLTTYIRTDLHEEIRRRYDNLEIDSITSLINAALEAYLASPDAES